MSCDKAHMGMKHALQNDQGFAAGGEGLIHHGAKFVPHPVEHRHPHRRLVREMAEQRSVSHADAVGDGLRSNPLGTVVAGQLNDSCDDGAAALGGRKPGALAAAGRRKSICYLHRLKSK